MKEFFSELTHTYKQGEAALSRSSCNRMGREPDAVFWGYLNGPYVPY